MAKNGGHIKSGNTVDVFISNFHETTLFAH